jgi:leucine dehydrogenase
MPASTARSLATNTAATHSAATSPFDFLAAQGHERLVIFHDPATDLRGAIAIHSTVRGPALGGTRLRAYARMEEGVLDALRLAEAMTYKAAVAGLPLGGGKAVLFADGREQDPAVREARLLAYGRVIEQLGGMYITAEDANTTMADMAVIRRATRHVAGLAPADGGGGDPSPVTAVGVLAGMQALAADVLGVSSLSGVRVAIQGLGKVGLALAELLVAEGAAVTACDVRPEVARAAAEALGIAVVAPEAIFDVPCAIFAPCAYGGVLDDETIPRLTCQIVAGSANNQLREPRHAEALRARGIAYAVDYVINAGGLINVAQELAPGGYDAAAARERTLGIAATVRRIQARAEADGISTERAAHALALDAIQPAAKSAGRKRASAGASSPGTSRAAANGASQGEPQGVPAGRRSAR